MPPLSTTLAGLTRVVDARRKSLDRRRALLVGISGIDGAGKGWVTERLASALQGVGHRVAVLHVDGWLNLPSIRFHTDRPAEHFYHHALRLDAFVDRLLLPLGAERAVDVVTDYAEERATTFRPQQYSFQDIDVVLAEGIYLFKRSYRPLFNLAVWVACSPETALERAIARAQEGLPPKATVEAYRRIYFPAQQIHAERDAPEHHADCVLSNDPRLTNTDAFPDPFPLAP
jgi:uridine kinase